ncbi:MAG: LLM class F420-dependent oxidoreductase [Acidimicrobiia bacterium]|nr:LLM class F420-dependent oxidoreductase [Acidimicrobiia bacterium]MDH4306889.1 LLM class F420-dependent oxidoreductase [Acidimicrobiia bacterium]
MKLGLMTGYWGAGPPTGIDEQIAAAERLGFDSVWTAEAYGSDALTPLAWWGASTSRIRLGTAIAQMAARTPTATAMAAMTMDHLSGGRFVLGLGVSGPQVVEGWYGQPYPKPLGRTREYVDIVRRVFAREEPVTFEGEHYQLPHPGGAGLGKALKSTVHPLRTDLPIMLAAEGPRNVALAAEIADGWLPFWFSPSSDAFYRAALAEGFVQRGARHDSETFEVVCPVPVIVSADPEDAADQIRPMLALYVGGMGAKGANFHYDVIARMGYEAEAERIQQLYLAGDKAAAIASIPLQMIEDVALVGPPAKIRDELPRWQDTVITTMLVSGPPPLLETMASIVG